MACVVMQKDLKQWFAELGVDLEKLQEICRYMLSFYEFMKTYDEKKEIAGLLAKMPKPKTQPSRYAQVLLAPCCYQYNHLVLEITSLLQQNCAVVRIA